MLFEPILTLFSGTRIGRNGTDPQVSLSMSLEVHCVCYQLHSFSHGQLPTPCVILPKFHTVTLADVILGQKTEQVLEQYIVSADTLYRVVGVRISITKDKVGSMQ